MTKIYKYPLEITDVQEIAMPENAEILYVEIQYDKPCLWARIDPTQTNVSRKIYIYGTGDEIAPIPLAYIGSFMMHGGTFGRAPFGHVFQEPTLGMQTGKTKPS